MKAAVAVGALLIAATTAGAVLASLGSPDVHHVAPSATPSPKPDYTSVLGLGDSVPAGDACGCPTFVTLLAQHRSAETHQIVTSQNLAQGGLTSLGLLQQVARQALHADPSTVTLVTIGANDFNSRTLSEVGCRSIDQLACYATALRSMTANVERMLAILAAGHHGPILVTGYWNVFLDGPVGAAQGSGYARDSDALTLQVNAALAKACAPSGAWYVDIYQPFKRAGRGEAALLAADGDHPSAKGHAVIAAALEASLAAHGL